MYSTDFLTVYASERIAEVQHWVWAESLRPGHRERLAQHLHDLAARLQPDLASTTALGRRRAH